jgi:hypothetical protein
MSQLISIFFVLACPRSEKPMQPTTFYLLLALLIVIAVLVILFMYRNRITYFLFKAGKEGGALEFKAGKPAQPASAQTAAITASPSPKSVVISGSQQKGEANVIDVGRSDVEVSDAVQEGKKQKIVVRPDKPTE